MNFAYDPMGNRAYKLADRTYTFYIRDAQGNKLSTYKAEIINQIIDTVRPEEYVIYGSSRLGVLKVGKTYEHTDSISYPMYLNRVRGSRQYELTNHLGNVQVVISDRKIPVDFTQNDTIDYFMADVIFVNDYYPFGMLMPDRSYTVSGYGMGDYKFGFNTQEKVDELKGAENHYTAPYWEYDPRVVHRWNVDPRANPAMSPYAILGGNPIWFTDFLGETVEYAGFKERLDVAISRLFSKDFRREFRELKNSKNVYKYTRFERGGIGDKSVGRVQLIDERRDDQGDVASQIFEIQYEKNDPDDPNAIGRSPFHGLFEETFHAVDYELGRSTSAITLPDQKGRRCLGHMRGDQTHEARAWNFAANFAPFAPKIVRFTNEDGHRVIVSDPLIQQIRELNSNPYNPNPQIANWLYIGWTINVEVPSTGQAGSLLRPPLY